MSTRYKRTNWVRRLEDFSSGCSSGFGLGQCLIAGILAIFSGISRLLPVTRWLSVTLSPDVPVVSTFGANSALKSPASIWRGVVFLFIALTLFYAHGASAYSATLTTEASSYFKKYPHDFNGTYYAVMIESSGTLNASNITIKTNSGNTTGGDKVVRIDSQYGLEFNISSPKIGQSLTITVKFFDAQTGSNQITRTFTFKVGLPPIEGLKAVSPYEKVTYSIKFDADSYSWTVPDSWKIVSGFNSNKITVIPGGNSYSGKISVIANISILSFTSEPLIVKMSPMPSYCVLDEATCRIDKFHTDKWPKGKCRTRGCPVDLASVLGEEYEIDFSRSLEPSLGSGREYFFEDEKSDLENHMDGYGIHITDFNDPDYNGRLWFTPNDDGKSLSVAGKVCRKGNQRGWYGSTNYIYAFRCDEEGWLGKPQIITPATDTCFHGTITLHATPAKAGYYKYKWYKDEKEVEITDQATYEATEGGYYQVSYYAQALSKTFAKSDMIFLKKAPVVSIDTVPSNTEYDATNDTYNTYIYGTALPYELPAPIVDTLDANTNYSWNVTQVENKYTVDKGGNYTVTYTNPTTTCAAKATLHLEVESGNASEMVEEGVKYYCISGKPNNEAYTWKLEGVKSDLSTTWLTIPKVEETGVPIGTGTAGLVQRFISNIPSNTTPSMSTSLYGVNESANGGEGVGCFSITDTIGTYTDFNLYVGADNPICEITDSNNCAYNPIIWKVKREGKCTFPPQNIIAQYSFETGNEGYVGNPVPTTGKVGDALSFSNSDRVELPSKPELNFGQDDFSIVMWVKTQQLNGTLLSKENSQFGQSKTGYSLYLSGGQPILRLGIGQGSWSCGPNASYSCTNYDSGKSINNGEWHLIAVTVDRDNPNGGRFYVDGAERLIFDPTLRADSLDNDNQLKMGMFQGELDEVVLFKRAITEAEIQHIYEADSDGMCLIDMTPPNPASVLSVTPSSQDVSATSSSFTFDVANTGNGTMDWTATSDSWLTINSASGTNDGTITVNYTANTDEARTGTITITADGAENSPQTVTVKQAKAIIERKGITWGKVSHDDALDVDYVNCKGCNAYSGETSCSSKLPILCLKKENLPNPGVYVPDEVSGAMQPKYYYGWTGGRIELTCPVNGNALKGIADANDICESQFGSGYKMAEFHDGNGGWGWYAYGNIDDNSRFWVNIDDQPSNCWGYGTGVSSDRTDAQISELLDDCQQSGNNGLSVSPTSKDVSATSGTFTFDVANTGNGTMDWTATSDSWLTINSASGTNDGTITVNYTANSGDARTGTITVTADGAENSPQTVEVKQAAKPCEAELSVTPDYKKVKNGDGTASFEIVSTNGCQAEWTIEGSSENSFASVKPTSGVTPSEVTVHYDYIDCPLPPCVAPPPGMTSSCPKISCGMKHEFSVLAPNAANSQVTFTLQVGDVGIEICPNKICNVSTTGSNTNNGSEAKPFATIQHGIDVAKDDYTVLVHPGTYIENINFNGKNIIVKSTDGAENTVIDGNNKDTVLLFRNGEKTTVDGFTITHGLNTSNHDAGGIGAFENSAPILKNLIVTGNVSHDGGGISCNTANPTLINVDITKNTSNVGAGIYIDNCNYTLRNVTVADNHAKYNNMGGGIFSHSSGKLNAINSIFWNNTPNNIRTSGTPAINFSYSDIQGGWEGEGNIDIDPLFENGYQLSKESPVLGLGTSENAPTTDLVGNLRPNPEGSNPDMGAYESVLGGNVPSSQVKLFVEPSALPVCQGKDFEVAIKAESSVAIDGAEVYLKFDQAQLEVSSITTSNNFDTEFLSEFDNANGSIEFMALNSSLITDSNFDIFTVKFSPVGNANSTNLEFVSGSQFTSGLDAIPSVALSNQQLDFAYCLEYQVDLQRANPKGDASWESDLTISVGTATNAIELTSTTNELGEGILTLSNPLDANDYFCVRGEQTLANKVLPPFTMNGTKVSFSENNGQNSPLLEGDVAKKDNGKPVAGLDGKIDLIDLKYVFANKIDLDRSGDFTGDKALLMANLKKIPLNGTKKHESACVETSTSNGSMLRRSHRDGKKGLNQLLANALPSDVVPGDSFDVTLTIQATESHPVDGTQFYLEYDPESLQINQATPTELLDVLLNDFDNSQGLLNLIVMAWDKAPSTSTFDLVTINFTLLKEGGEKTLHFSEDARQESMVYAGDELVENLEEVVSPQVKTSISTANYKASGTILDKEGNPVAGVTVQVGDKTALTNAAGNWEITDLAESNYTVTASKDGYIFGSKDFAVGNDQNASVSFKAESVLDVKVISEPGTAQQGENITYTITVTNKGSEIATGVVLTDTLPTDSSLVSIEALDGGNCSAETVSCTLSDLTPGATATIKLVISNTKAAQLVNTAKVTANDYPADVQITRTTVTPYFSVSLSDTPDPVTMGGTLHYTVEVDLSQFAPKDATGVELVLQLPNGVELENATTDHGSCDSSKLPTVTCTINDLSIASAEAISHITVNLNVTLIDMGLLLLTHDAKVTSTDYPAHSVKERTKIFIGDVKVDMVFVIDTTYSMAAEINGVIVALRNFIEKIDPSKAPLIVLVEFKDDVRFKAATRDLDILFGAVEDLKAEGGGTCPEASAEALTLAVEHLKDGGVILFTTDASPYADADLEKLGKLMSGKDMNLVTILTGDCSNQDDWNVLP